MWCLAYSPTLWTSISMKYRYSKVSWSFLLWELWSFTLLYSSWRYIILLGICPACQWGSLKFPALSRCCLTSLQWCPMCYCFFFYTNREAVLPNLGSASNDFGHWFWLTDPLIGLFWLLLPVLVEDVSEDTDWSRCSAERCSWYRAQIPWVLHATAVN